MLLLHCIYAIPWQGFRSGVCDLYHFLTDGNPIMASASTEGHIAFWDLEKRQLGTALRDAHKGVVCGMTFLPSQPLLVTNGPDNSLKVIL